NPSGPGERPWAASTGSAVAYRRILTLYPRRLALAAAPNLCRPSAMRVTHMPCLHTNALHITDDSYWRTRLLFPVRLFFPAYTAIRWPSREGGGCDGDRRGVRWGRSPTMLPGGAAMAIVRQIEPLPRTVKRVRRAPAGGVSAPLHRDPFLAPL